MENIHEFIFCRGAAEGMQLSNAFRGTGCSEIPFFHMDLCLFYVSSNSISTSCMFMSDSARRIPSCPAAMTRRANSSGSGAVPRSRYAVRREGRLAPERRITGRAVEGLMDSGVSVTARMVPNEPAKSMIEYIRAAQKEGRPKD